MNNPQHDPAVVAAVSVRTMANRTRRVEEHNASADANKLHLVAVPDGRDPRIRCIRPGGCEHLSWSQCRAFFRGAIGAVIL